MTDDFRETACQWGEAICYYVAPHTTDGRFVHNLILVCAHWIRDYGGAIGALGGVAFGVLQWYWSWERKMFEQVEVLLKKDDRQLLVAGRQLFTMISEPGPAVAVAGPKFSDAALNEVLRAGNWRSILSFTDAKTEADLRLDKATRGIEKRRKDIREHDKSLVEQLATAHLTRGAIAASRARRKWLSELDKMN